MRTTLTGRNVSVSAGLRQLVSRHLAKVDRLVGDAIVSAQVVVSGERHENLTDITLHMRGDHVLTGVGRGPTWPASVKSAAERLVMQAQKVKGKWTTRKRRAVGRGALGLVAAGEAPVVPPAPADAATWSKPRVYRSRTAIRSLTIDAAAERLTRGDDAFLVFRNADTGRVAVMQRRGDGHVALTEPDR